MPRIRHTLAGFPLFLLAVLAVGGCGSAETPPPHANGSAPPAGSPMDTALFGLGSRDEGERLFGQECAFCHVGKATGTMMLGRRLGQEQAELVRRTDLDPDYVKAVVRNGLLNMPPLSKVELTDTELDKIAAYLSDKSVK